MAGMPENFARTYKLQESTTYDGDSIEGYINVACLLFDMTPMCVCGTIGHVYNVCGFFADR